MRRLLLGLLLGCGASTSTEVADTGAVDDAAVDAIAETTPDAVDPETTSDAPSDASKTLRPCPTTGKGAVAGDACFLLTPAEAGLPAGGVNATVDQYALRPTSGARGKLVVFFNGSGGSPLAGTRGSATTNFYATARAAGLHVVALSYRSDDAIGTLCKGEDACFLPTRRTVMTGVHEAGAAPSLAGIAVHEGALARLINALAALSARDPSGGWGAFVDLGALPVDRVKWPLVMAAGHSQGGGHAALIGKMFAVDRVVALSSPCDQTTTGPASWLDVGKTPYATSPAAVFHGLGAPGDAICSGYPAIWESLGIAAARRHADATVCAGATPHSASVECVENAPTWTKMLE
ncbi:MAG: hypothetical protein IPJ34_42710 [Myxococcales bacterium]|nr:hypothetical protein [Myxococcales bacterium]